MKKIGVKKIIITSIFVAVFALIGTSNNYASAAGYTIQIKNSLTGDELSNHEFEFELRDAVTNELIQTKTSSEETITFDPIDGNFSRASIDFYKIIEKDLGENGMTYDNQIAYIGFRSDGKVSYQKDNTYKYLSKDGIPHPYHASDADLHGEAYIEIDTQTGVETFFRDDPGKYICEKNQSTSFRTVCPFIGDKLYISGVESNSFTFPSGVNNIYSNTGDNFDLRNIVKEVVVKDAIRPVGKMDNWFYYYKSLKKADINKLVTSKVTSMRHFFAYDENLTDVDITKLDFSNLQGGGSLQSAFAYADKLQEFDSRHYDFSSTTGLYVTQEFFTGGYNSDLRYVNLERMVSNGASAEFSDQNCVEKLVLGEKHSLYNGGSRLGDGSRWLKIDSNEMVTDNRFKEYMPELMKSAAGTYVNPTCNVTPVTFDNSYRKPEAIHPNTDTGSRNESKIIKTLAPEEDVENPNTTNSTPVVFLAFINILSVGILLAGCCFIKHLR